MAKKSGVSQEFYVHGFDLSGDVGSISNAASPRPTQENTGINKAAVERILLPHADGEISFNSWFNKATEASHEALSTLVTTDRVVTWAFGGAVGDVAAILNAKQINYDPSRDADGGTAITIQALADGEPLEWGTMLSAGQITHPSAQSSTPVDVRGSTAQSTAGIVAALQVIDIDSGTPTVVIEDSSSSGGSFTALATFAAIGAASAPTAERVTTAGEVLRWMRITSTGTFSNADFAVAIRVGSTVDTVTIS